MSSVAKVDRLINAALDAMMSMPMEFSDEEALSACFSLALRMSKAAKARNPKLAPQVEAGARLLLLQCADEDCVH